MWKHKEKLILLLTGVMFIMFGCSENTNDYSPEKMINNALDEGENQSYIGESITTVSEEGEEIETFQMKEWRDNEGKIRIETESDNKKDQAIAVNDGKSVTMYHPDKNEAIVVDDEEILEYNQPSPKEQIDMLLDTVKDTHDISVEGEEEIVGRQTVHLIATPKEEGTLFGKQEFWIDKENWFVLKSVSMTGNQETETIYTKIDFDVDIPADKFNLDLPEDVDIVDSDSMLETEEVTLAQAKEALGQEFLYFPETNGLEITKIEMDELTGELERVEINMDYDKDGAPYLSLAVFESPEDMDGDIEFPDEEDVTIRGQEATYTDMDGFRGLVWQENGLNYSLIITEPRIELEDLKTLTEEMETEK